MNLNDLTIKQFLDKTASNEPMPAGGSVLPLCAALSASLTEMVAKLIIVKAKNTKLDKRMREICSELEKTRMHLMTDINRDAESYQLVLDAYQMPKDYDDEVDMRIEEIQRSLKVATLVQLEVAEKCHSLFNYIMEVSNIVEGSLAADSKVSLMICSTSAKGAILNVRTNLSQIIDNDFKCKIIARCDKIENYFDNNYGIV